MNFFDYTLIHCCRQYGSSPDAIIQRSYHRKAFGNMVRKDLNRERSSATNDQICMRLETLRKRGLVIKGIYREEKVLMIPPQFDATLKALRREFLIHHEIQETELVGMDEHRARFTCDFNAATGNDWSEDKVIIRLVQLRKGKRGT